MTTAWVPCDAAAVALGADAVADALTASGVSVRRNGSRGMLWLEPLVEVETAGGRVGYGNVTASDVVALVDGALDDTERCIGVVEAHEWLAGQHRVSFARVGVIEPTDLAAYRDHGGLAGLQRALSLASEEVVAEVTASGLRGRGGAGFPAGIKWETVRTATADVKFVCCNADEGDSGTFADRMLIEGDPFTLDRGDGDRGARGRRHRGLRLPAQRVPPRDPHAAPRDRHRLRPRGARRVGARQRAAVRPRRAGGRRRLHLRRGDLDARVARGQAGRGARQAADPGPRGAVRPADRRQQRADPRRGADGARRRWRGVCRTGHGPLARHPGVPARRQRRPGRHRRGRLRGVARRARRRASVGARHPGDR